MLLLCLLFSATGGADSRNVSEKGSPTEEQAGAVGNGKLLVYFFMMCLLTFLCFFNSVTHKVTAGAKSFGSFLYGAVNKAGAKIKESVKDNVSFNYIWNFEKEFQ